MAANNNRRAAHTATTINDLPLAAKALILDKVMEQSRLNPLPTVAKTIAAISGLDREFRELSVGAWELLHQQLQRGEAGLDWRKGAASGARYENRFAKSSNSFYDHTTPSVMQVEQRWSHFAGNQAVSCPALVFAEKLRVEGLTLNWSDTMKEFGFHNRDLSKVRRETTATGLASAVKHVHLVKLMDAIAYACEKWGDEERLEQRLKEVKAREEAKKPKVQNVANTAETFNINNFPW